MGKPETESKEEFKLSDAEKKSLQLAREAEQRAADCGKAIDEVLRKYNCDLVIDPNSPIRNPSIVVQLLK